MPECPPFALRCSQKAQTGAEEPSLTLDAPHRHRRHFCSPKKTMVKRIMTNALPSFTSLTDAQLLTQIKMLAEQERRSTAALIAALTELDARRLYLGDGYPSLFAYCTQALHFSEDAAYNRIRAARVAAKWPMVLEMIADGSITVTALRLLSDALTNANHEELLRGARHKSKRELEEIVAALRPQLPVAASLRKVATPVPAPVAAAPLDALLSGSTPLSRAPHRPGQLPQSVPIAKAATIAPLSPDQYKIQFTIPKLTHDKLRRVQDLMRHTNPSGNPAVIFDRGLTLLLEYLERVRLGKAGRPRSHQRPMRAGSRHVPSAVKREVWARDGGRCAFVGAAGRCGETGFLEYHHGVPYADGGATVATNIQLRCRAHNAYEAEEWFGPLVVREQQPRYDAW